MAPEHTPQRRGLFNDERAGRIYRTAARMIYEKGFDATSMSEIADAVEMTKAGVYYYVKGKKELLFAIMSFAMDMLDREVSDPARKITDPEGRLRTLVAEHARLLTNDTSPLVILMDEVGSLSEDFRRRIVDRKRRYFDLVRGTLEELREAGKLQGVDTTVAAFSLLGQVMWLARWYRPDGRLSPDEVVRHITRIALGGVLLTKNPRGNQPEGLPVDA